MKPLEENIIEQGFPFWKVLTAQEKNRMQPSVRRVQYGAGELLHSGTEECTGMIAVQKGQLRVSILSEEGREVTLYRLFPGDNCILSASCVLDAITFDVNIVAEEETEVLLLSASIFHQIAEENMAVKCFGYELAIGRFSDVMWVMQQILFMSMDKRLAIFLLEEVAKSGSLELKLTQEQIAKYMGSAREVVSRMLKYFVQEGIVAVGRGKVQILEKQKLYAVAKGNV